MSCALDAHHRLGDLCADGGVATGDQALGQHLAVRHLPLADAAFATAAHRLFLLSNVVDHLGEFVGQ